MTFTVTDENGAQITFETLFTFASDETKKDYIVYTDNTTDEEGNTKVYASIYEPTENGEIKENTKLTPIETESEWKIIETILEEIQKEVEEGEKSE